MEFKKSHEFLVCFDSDGCVMDTMDCKHIRCFGPCMVEEWNLHEWEDDILRRWNEVNLYQMTRGINRFKGLALALTEVDQKYVRVPGVAALSEWANNAKALSNDSLEAAIEAAKESDGKQCLMRALAWSNAVNKSIVALPDELKVPYKGAATGLAAAHEFADVAVVSSANRAAVEEEWGSHGLLQSVDVIMAQDSGSKAACIAHLTSLGYAPDHVLMVGDAPGDLDAADASAALFYPIIVGHETSSWIELVATALPNLKSGLYAGDYALEKRTAFFAGLGA